MEDGGEVEREESLSLVFFVDPDGVGWKETDLGDQLPADRSRELTSRSSRRTQTRSLGPPRQKRETCGPTVRAAMGQPEGSHRPWGGNALGLVGEGALGVVQVGHHPSSSIKYRIVYLYGLRATVPARPACPACHFQRAWSTDGNTGYLNVLPLAASIPKLALHRKKKEIYSPVSELRGRKHAPRLFEHCSNLNTKIEWRSFSYVHISLPRCMSRDGFRFVAHYIVHANNGSWLRILKN